MVRLMPLLQGMDEVVDKSDVITQLVAGGQENLCQQWVTSLGKDYQVRPNQERPNQDSAGCSLQTHPVSLASTGSLALALDRCAACSQQGLLGRMKCVGEAVCEALAWVLKELVCTRKLLKSHHVLCTAHR